MTLLLKLRLYRLLRVLLIFNRIVHSSLCALVHSIVVRLFDLIGMCSPSSGLREPIRKLVHTGVRYGVMTVTLMAGAFVGITGIRRDILDVLVVLGLPGGFRSSGLFSWRTGVSVGKVLTVHIHGVTIHLGDMPSRRVG